MVNVDTIAAISTAPGTGAIAIIRMSGERAFSILEKIFSTDQNPDENIDWSQRSRTATHGYIHNPQTGELVDEVVVIVYKGPITYTGEDLVEIDCHGSPLLSREILELCIKQGARLARPGEFTQRAFLAGRMDLTQAEAVLDLIQAKTGRQSRLAISTVKGHLGKQIKDVRAQLMELLSRVVAGIDFPEEVGEVPLDDIGEIVSSAKAQLDKLARTARSGRFLREGLRMSIVGRPNAGKSSLLNQLLNFERAIVTDIPGTTRDSIEEPLDLNGVPIILIDTAGIRATQDAVEKIGIERTASAIAASDVALLVVDLTQGWQSEEDEILKMVDGIPYIVVANKIDLAPEASGSKVLLKNFEPSSNSTLCGLQANRIDTTENMHNSVNTTVEVSASCIDTVSVSAKTGAGMELITGAIERWALSDAALAEAGGSLNQRQGELCTRALDALAHLEEAVQLDLPQDCLATDLTTAIHCLSEACGDEITEEVISEVFSRFCIGK